MSDDIELDDDDITLDAKPPHRDSIQWLFYDPRVRNYVFAGFAAIAMMFVILFSFGSLPGAAMIVLLGVAGLLLRWTGTPPLVLMILFWFLAFPYGLPPGYEDRYEIVNGRFRIADMMLVFSVLVYVACHYRVLGLSHQALPFDGPTKRKGEKPYRRPVDVIRAGELARLLMFAGGAVLVGQFVWLFVTIVEADPGSFVPLKFAEQGWSVTRRNEPNDRLSAGVSRFIVLTGLLFFTVLLARLIFGYWRLRQMGPVEARIILQDEGWNEARREQMRIEKWRSWAREQHESAAQQKLPRGRRGESS